MRFLPYSLFWISAALIAQNQPIVWNSQEKPIAGQLRQLRSLSDKDRSAATRKLALQIRHLPITAKKEVLAEQLANLATEGDPGRGALQEVATTLAQALREQPVADNQGK